MIQFKRKKKKCLLLKLKKQSQKSHPYKVENVIDSPTMCVHSFYRNDYIIL